MVKAKGESIYIEQVDKYSYLGIAKEATGGVTIE